MREHRAVDADMHQVCRLVTVDPAVHWISTTTAPFRSSPYRGKPFAGRRLKRNIFSSWSGEDSQSGLSPMIGFITAVLLLGLVDRTHRITPGFGGALVLDHGLCLRAMTGI